MLVVGAKGFAKEILEICKQNNELRNLVFYDDLSNDLEDRLFNLYEIIKNGEDAKTYLEQIDNRFTIGIGNPELRKSMYNLFCSLGGKYTSTISLKADIGSYNVNIGCGANILDGSKISNNVEIGIGSILYYNSIVTHDCVIGDFVEVSPSATILGNCFIGNCCNIGANSVILPKIKLGNNVIVGAGAVVCVDLPDNCTAVGVPAKIIKIRN